MTEPDRIRRITQMERYFDILSQTDPKKIPGNPGLSELLSLLADYYENGQWLEDYRADEQGLLPKDLKRGILSEDGVWNLLCDIDFSSRDRYNRSNEEREEFP